MPDYQDHLLIYLRLARLRKNQLKISDHDRLMVLSAEAACELGKRPLAEYCRSQVIKNNPGHMIGRYDTVNEALADADFQYFLSQIRRRNTIEYAETALEKSQIDVRQELAGAESLEVYLQQLLGVDLTWIDDNFGD